MTELLMPKLGLTMTEGTIVEWLKQAGDAVRKGEPLFVFETEKSTLEFEAPDTGVLGEIRVQPGQTVACYAVVGLIAETVAAIQPLKVDVPGANQASHPNISADNALPFGRTFRASPRAKKAARERGIDLNRVSGTGPRNRITEADVFAFTSAPATPLARRIAAAANVELAGVNGSGRGGKVVRADVERITVPTSSAEAPPDLSDIRPFTAVRAITGRHMMESVQSAPQVTLTTEADAVELIHARAKVNALTTGGRISYNAIFMLICAHALSENPDVNATYTTAGLRVNASVNIGLAVDTARGLLVPVVRDVKSLRLNAIQTTLTEKIERARDGKSPPSDFEGGTFTISNLGMYDIDAFTPIVNLPEAAILGIGRIVQKVVPYEGQVAIREQVALSLSFDHRAIDGGPAARFLKRVKDLIKNPYGLLLG